MHARRRASHRRESGIALLAPGVVGGHRRQTDGPIDRRSSCRRRLGFRAASRDPGYDSLSRRKGSPGELQRRVDIETRTRRFVENRTIHLECKSPSRKVTSGVAGSSRLDNGGRYAVIIPGGKGCRIRSLLKPPRPRPPNGPLPRGRETPPSQEDLHEVLRSQPGEGDALQKMWQQRVENEGEGSAEGVSVRGTSRSADCPATHVPACGTPGVL